MPQGAGPFPLCVWFPGTGEIPKKSASCRHVCIAMARQGWFAVAVQYPDLNNINELEAKAQAVADLSNTDSAVSIVSGGNEIDESAGIAVGGYSQGTHLAVLAAKFNNKISAAFLQSGARPTIGEGDDFAICDDARIGQYLPKSRRRYALGEGDQYYAWTAPWVSFEASAPSCEGAKANLKLASGYDGGAETNCLQEDGSGYYVLTASDSGGKAPDHFNWFNWGGIFSSAGPPEWYDSQPYGFTASLNWLDKAGRQARDW